MTCFESGELLGKLSNFWLKLVFNYKRIGSDYTFGALKGMLFAFLF